MYKSWHLAAIFSMVSYSIRICTEFNMSRTNALFINKTLVFPLSNFDRIILFNLIQYSKKDFTKVAESVSRVPGHRNSPGSDA